MRTGIAAVRAYHLREYYAQVAERSWNAALTSKTRVSTKILKQILLERGDLAFFQGRSVQLKKRSLGAGVYEIWFEKEKEIKV